MNTHEQTQTHSDDAAIKIWYYITLLLRKPIVKVVLLNLALGTPSKLLGVNSDALKEKLVRYAVFVANMRSRM